MKRHKTQKLKIKPKGYKSTNLVRLAFVFIFACLGVYLLTRSFATTPIVAFKGFVNTDDGIHTAVLSDVFDNPQTLAGKVDYAWASQNSSVPGIHHDYYIPLNADTQHPNNSGLDGLQWFQTNHPDWVAYTCDANGQPTRTPASYDNDPSNPLYTHLVQLDWSNPAVMEYQFEHAKYVLGLLRGWGGISWDNFVFNNNDNICGVYKGGPSNPWGGWTYLGYPGWHDTNTTYATNLTSWLKYVAPRIHALGYTLTVNSPLSTAGNGVADYPNAYPYIDADLDENGFTKANNGRLTDSRWQDTLAASDRLNAANKAIISNNYTHVNASQVTSSEMNWILANYLLIKGHYTYVIIDTDDHLHGTYLDWPQFHIPIGSATSKHYVSQGIYMRNYSGGMTIVNPSSTASFHVNLGKTYNDMYGNMLSSLTLAPATGMVLLNPPAAAVPSSTPATPGSKATTTPASTKGGSGSNGTATHTSTSGENSSALNGRTERGLAKSSAAGGKIEGANVKSRIFAGTSILCFLAALILYVVHLHRPKESPLAGIHVHTTNVPEPKPLNGSLPQPGSVISPKETHQPPPN